jgi:hypothetical protein
MDNETVRQREIEEPITRDDEKLLQTDNLVLRSAAQQRVSKDEFGRSPLRLTAGNRRRGD